MKQSANPRALAARALADVALHGVSLREALAPALAPVADARDRAFITALASEGARWWLRYDAALARLLARPLPRKEAPLRALLVLALVQLEVLRLPAYAAVAATVDATRALGRPRMAGLANAVLRRWQRERDGLLQTLDTDPVTRSAWPDWLLARLQRDWPDTAATIIATAAHAPPPTLRVNRRRTTRDAWLQQLAASEVEATIDPHLADAVHLATHTDITRLPGFAEGAFSVQSGAAQWAVEALDLHEGLRVLDACAAPGGKTAHALERAKVDMLALDSDARRLERVRANLDRLGLDAQLRAADAAAPDTWWDGQAFDRILLDAPCSATGVIARHPDIKLHRRASDVDALAANQARLLESLWPLLAPGGRLVYATCSLLESENAAVVARFLAGRDDVRSGTWLAPSGRHAGPGIQLLPGVDGNDGMYYALLDKVGD